MLRDEGLGIIMGMKPEYFRASYTTRADVPELMVLIGYDSRTKSIPVWAPIIHARKPDGQPDFQKPFQNDALPQVRSITSSINFSAHV